MAACLSTGVGFVTKSLVFFSTKHKIPDFRILTRFASSSTYAKSSKVEFFSSTTKRVIVGSIFGSFVGGFYAYKTFPSNKLKSSERKQQYVASHAEFLTDNYIVPPDIKPSRHVKGTSDALGLKLSLYQYQTCPFCCKVRAFLEYYSIPYDVIEVNPVLRQQIKFSKYKKVPILLIEDEKGCQQLNDSTVIISLLSTHLMDSKVGLDEIANMYAPLKYIDEESGKEVSEVMNRYFLMFGDKTPLSRSEEDIKEERKWRRWADDVLVHMLSPNIYQTPREALQAFHYFSKVGDWEANFPIWERYLVIYVGAAAMYLVGKRLKKKYSLKENVRESLYDACREWNIAIGKDRIFLGGNMPNLADLAVYGVLNSIEGCEAFQDLLKNTKIGPWYFRTKEAVSNHYGSKATQARIS
ncbi:prostaglandin E synthase 2-like [Limulus polyphemus]|uniref:Prostaglandin E synthase 2 n=1 Tax=Limulus polyphemus TaxID=6850 RepID=A0ABM1C1D8_LIMPO|nr:prostaglandin E synthase 2-like [Limulus polyphemus]